MTIPIIDTRTRSSHTPSFWLSEGGTESLVVGLYGSTVRAQVDYRSREPMSWPDVIWAAGQTSCSFLRDEVGPWRQYLSVLPRQAD